MNGVHVNGVSSQDKIKSKPEPYTQEVLENIAKYLLQRTNIRPRIGIICGSGLGSLADSLSQREAFPYEDIPDFPVSTVAGHVGKLVSDFLKMFLLCVCKAGSTSMKDIRFGSVQCR